MSVSVRLLGTTIPESTWQFALFIDGNRQLFGWINVDGDDDDSSSSSSSKSKSKSSSSSKKSPKTGMDDSWMLWLMAAGVFAGASVVAYNKKKG